MHVASRVWIFDLDNTLHDANPHVFPHINNAMTRYVMSHLQLEEAAASELRQHYWHKYGATLHGLVRHHGVDPHHFLHHTHQFAALEGLVLKTRGLREALDRLSGRKVIFTNSPMVYAMHVLDILRIRRCFERVFSIESSRFQPKPSKPGFMRILAQLNMPPESCIMVEDSLPALRTAKALGMKTIYIHPKPQRPAYVDARANSVLALPGIAANL